MEMICRQSCDLAQMALRAVCNNYANLDFKWNHGHRVVSITNHDNQNDRKNIPPKSRDDFFAFRKNDEFQLPTIESIRTLPLLCLRRPDPIESSSSKGCRLPERMEPRKPKNQLEFSPHMWTPHPPL